jgi:hypothetical protein
MTFPKTLPVIVSRSTSTTSRVRYAHERRTEISSSIPDNTSPADISDAQAVALRPDHAMIRNVPHMYTRASVSECSRKATDSHAVDHGASWNKSALMGLRPERRLPSATNIYRGG